MEVCHRCRAEFEIPSGSNIADSTLDELLKNVVKASVNLNVGSCELGSIDQIFQEGVTRSQQWHADEVVTVRTAIDAVHSHVQLNYEEDD